MDCILGKFFISPVRDENQILNVCPAKYSHFDMKYKSEMRGVVLEQKLLSSIFI